MGKPIGSSVGLYYDSAEPVEPGDYLQTPTGRSYLVSKSRMQLRGIHAWRRQHLRAVLVDQSDVPPDATVHQIVWYKR